MKVVFQEALGGQIQRAATHVVGCEPIIPAQSRRQAVFTPRTSSWRSDVPVCRRYSTSSLDKRTTSGVIAACSNATVISRTMAFNRCRRTLNSTGSPRNAGGAVDQGRKNVD